MFSNQPKIFYDSIKPLLYHQRIIGIGIFRHPNQNRRLFFLICLWSICINFFSFACTCYSYYNVLNGTYAFASSYIGSITMHVVSITNCIHTLIAPLFLSIQRKVVWENFRELQFLDDKFQALFGVDVNQEYRRRFFRTCLQIFGINLMIASTALFFFSWTWIYYDLSLSLAICLSLFQSTSIIITLGFNFWIILSYIEKKFRDLNDSLLRLANTNSFSSPKGLLLSDTTSNVLVIRPWQKTEKCIAETLINEKRYFLKEMRKLHSEISKLSGEINSAFGIQNLLTAGTSFIILVGVSYKIYETLEPISSTNQTRSESQMVGFFFSAFFHAFRIWMITHSSWNVTREAKKTGEIIYELLKSHPNKELRREIQIFSIQMLKNPVSFNACGFFTLDHIFIKRVIATISTYLVILIQMSSSPETEDN